MKGKIILRTLCAGLILASVAGCSGVTSSSTSTSEATSSESSAIQYYSVSATLKGTGAYLDVDVTSAKKGQTVQLTVVLTDENYEVDSVKVGDKTVSGSTSSLNSRIRYYLYTVGEEDVNFVVTTYDTVAAKSHSISYDDENGLSHADGLATRKDAGEEVEFTIGTVSGYSVEGLEIYYMDGVDKVDVDYTGNSVTGYKFTMPDANVVIKPTVLGAYFEVAVDAKQVVGTYTSYGTERETKTTDFVYTMYVENGIDDEGVTQYKEAKNFFARAGSKCYIVRKNMASLRVADFLIDGTKVEKDEEEVIKDTETYSFVMPNHNVDVVAEVTDLAKVGQISLTLDETDSSHLDVELFKIVDTPTTDEEGTVTHSYSKEAFDGTWKYGETIYVAAIAKEGTEGIDVKSLVTTTTSYKYSYQTVLNDPSSTTTSWGSGYSYSDTHKADLSGFGDEIASQYTGQVVMQYTPSSSYTFDSITIKVIEKDANKYANTQIVKNGTYHGAEMYSFYASSTKPVTKTSSYCSSSLSVGGDGGVKLGTTDKDSLPSSYNDNIGLFTGLSGYKMFYDGGSVFAISYYSSASSNIVSDLYVASSKLTGTNSTIKLISTLNSSYTSGAVLFGFYQDGECVDYLLIYFTEDGTQVGTSKVEVSYADGADPFGGSAKVVVKDKEGTVLYTFNKDADDGDDSSSSADLTSLNGNYDCGNNVYFNIWVDDSSKEITYMDQDNGTEVNTTFTYDASTKKGSFGTIGVWDGDNYFIVNDNGTITFHLNDEYSENTVTKTGTKVA